MIFWFCFMMFYKITFKKVIKKFLITLAIETNLFLSAIINALANFVNCSEIDNEFYITNYLAEKCSNNYRYSLWRNALIIPSFIVFAVILPLLAFNFMFKNRQKLLSKNIIQYVGFLLSGFEIKKFYW